MRCRAPQVGLLAILLLAVCVLGTTLASTKPTLVEHHQILSNAEIMLLASVDTEQSTRDAIEDKLRLAAFQPKHLVPDTPRVKRKRVDRLEKQQMLLDVDVGNDQFGSDARLPQYPCVLNNGCQCNHTLVTNSPVTQGQNYGTCVSCSPGWSGWNCGAVVIDCVNGGVLDPKTRVCQCTPPWIGPSCGQHECLHSVGGAGPLSIAPADPETNLCTQCEPGWKGVACDMCTVDTQCGSGSHCNTSFVAESDNKQMLCELGPGYWLNELTDSRPGVRSIITNDCVKPSGFSDPTADGSCFVTISRIEPNNTWMDPFTFCDLRQCNTELTVETVPAVVKSVANAGRIRYDWGWALIALPAALALNGVAYHRRRGLVFAVFGGLIVVGYLAFVVFFSFFDMVEVSPAYSQGFVSYNCQEMACRCASNPPSFLPQFDPVCIGSTFQEYIPILIGPSSLKCPVNVTSAQGTPCVMKLAFALFDVNCTASECVSKSSDQQFNTLLASVAATTLASEIIGLVLGGVLCLALLHFLFWRVRFGIASSEFHRQFGEFPTASLDSSDEGMDMVAPPAAPTPGGVAPLVTFSAGSIVSAGHVKGASVTSRTSTSVSTTAAGVAPASDPLQASLLVGAGGSSTSCFEPAVQQQVQHGFSNDTNGAKHSHHDTAVAAAQAGVDDVYESSGSSQRGNPQRCAIVLENATYSVSSAGREKKVLDEVCLVLRSGETLALMGPSGAGKTTLLDVLALRTLPGKLAVKKLSINGRAVGPGGVEGATVGTRHDRNTYRRMVGFVAQTDSLIPALTVEQTIRFAARLKLPAPLSDEVIAAVVSETIEALGLESCADSLVGDQTRRGISGGEKRRVSIATELVANPRVLFLDEPTSGLDSVNAFEVMRAVANLARRGGGGGGARTRHPHTPASALVPQNGSGGMNKNGVVVQQRQQQQQQTSVTPPGAAGSGPAASRSKQERRNDGNGVLKQMTFFSFRPAVVFSIHQPSHDIYAMFDRVALLAEGRLLYSGPAAEAVTRVSFAIESARLSPSQPLPHSFAGDGLVERSETSPLLGATPNTTSPYLTAAHSTVAVPPFGGPMGARGLPPLPGSNGTLPQRQDSGTIDSTVVQSPRTPLTFPNPAEALLQLAYHADARALEALADSADQDQEVERAAASLVTDRVLETAAEHLRFYPNSWQQVALLTRRTAASLMGSYYLVAAHALAVVVLSLLLDRLYRKEGLTLSGTENKAGMFSFLLLITAFSSLSSIEAIIMERPLFVVERENGLYSTLPYFAVKIMFDFGILRILPTLMLSSLIYAAMGLRVDLGSYFFYFCCIVVIFSLFVTCICIIVSTVSPSFGSAALFSSLLILWHCAFGGLMVQGNSIPADLSFFKYMSPFFFAFEALMVNELDGQQCTFDPSNTEGQKEAAVVPIPCRQFLYNLDLNPANFKQDISLMVIWVAGLLVVAFFSMRFLVGRGRFQVV